MKTPLKLSLFLVAFTAVAWLGKPLLSLRGPDQFSSERLVTDFKEPYDIEESNETARTILSSLAENGVVTFDYLGHGSQMAAFGGKNGCVLKLLLAREIQGPKKGRIPSLLRVIPAYRNSRNQKREERRRRKLENVLSAYAISIRHLKEETGLVSIHLHPTESLFPKCLVRDRYGKVHEIDLDRAVFFLQKKAELLVDRFARTKSAEEYREVVAAMDRLLESHIRKGFSDFNDRFKLENYGFVDGKAIFLDSGRITYSKEVEDNPSTEIDRMKRFFHTWLTGLALKKRDDSI